LEEVVEIIQMGVGPVVVVLEVMDTPVQLVRETGVERGMRVHNKKVVEVAEVEQVVGVPIMTGRVVVRVVKAKISVLNSVPNMAMRDGSRVVVVEAETVAGPHPVTLLKEVVLGVVGQKYHHLMHR
jgi:hypothetical protein